MYQRRNVDNRGGWFPSIFGMNPFNLMPSTMSDVFDSVNLDIDRLLDRSLHWINVPTTGRQQQQQQTRQRQMPRQQSMQQQRQQQQLPKHLQQQQQQQQHTKMAPMSQTQQLQQSLGKMPQKFRILIDCSTCDPRSLKTHIKTVNDQKHLIVCEEQKGSKKVKCEPSYACKQFKRTYTLPKQVDTNKMISFVTPNGQFVVEFPLVEVPCSLDIDMVPKIEKTAEGRCVSLRVPIPQSIDPSKVTLTVKGHNVILRFVERFSMEDRVSRVYFYNRCMLPDSADLNRIKCCADKHRLIITAPLRTDSSTWQTREIPIQRKLRHKALLTSGEQKKTTGISGQKQSISTQQQQQKKKDVSTKMTSRSKSPLTTQQQKQKSSSSSIKTSEKSEKQKQKSPTKETQQTQQMSSSGKQKKKSLTSEEKTGSDILKSVFGSGQSGEKQKQGSQKSKSSGESKPEFPLLPSDVQQSESHHQQQ
jgi:hypothetical protein